MASKAIWPCIKWPFILASAAVAYVLFLVLALVCIVFFTILLLLSPLLLLFKYFHPDYQQKEIPAREDEVLQERLHETGKRYDHVYLDAEVHGIRVRLHSIAIESRGKPIVVFVHGTAGSALGFTEALRQLCDRFSIHALDLPGFGRSTTEENRKVRKMPTPDLIRWYCDCLKLYIERCTDGHRVSILGHSFGGFLVVEFASFYPDMVEKLILVDSAGIYPILGRSGAYWSVFFSASLPQTFLRVCSYIGGDVLGHWVLSCYNASPWMRFYYHLLSNRNAYGDLFLSRYIEIGVFQTRCTAPLLPKILSMEVPLALFYGEKDPIMPPGQGELLVELCGTPIPLVVVRDAQHAPYSDNPDAFCEAFEPAWELACKPDQQARQLAKVIEERDLMRHFKSSYSSTVMDRVIKRLIHDLKQIKEELREQQGLQGDGPNCAEGAEAVGTV